MALLTGHSAEKPERVRQNKRGKTLQENVNMKKDNHECGKLGALHRGREKCKVIFSNI